MTRFLSRLFLAAVLSASLATPALAQNKGKTRATAAKKATEGSARGVKRSKKRAAKRSKTPKKAVAKKAKNYDFEADKIDGDRINPDGSTIFGLGSNKKPSLIRVRGHFIPEILKSAENI